LVFIAGLLYANLLEWILHKYVLHGLGKNKNSSWASHWHTHHKKSRQNDFLDDDYGKKGWNESTSREKSGLVFLAILHLPILLVSVAFYVGVLISAFRYYYIHKKSHLDPEWAKKNVPWHYDHHMGKNQDANWGITTDWVDRVMGTRINYHDRKAGHPMVVSRQNSLDKDNKR